MGVAEEGKESQAVGRLGDSSWTWPGLLIRTITICWQAIKCRAGLGWDRVESWAYQTSQTGTCSCTCSQLPAPSCFVSDSIAGPAPVGNQKPPQQLSAEAEPYGLAR